MGTRIRELAERLRSGLPPGTIGALEGDDGRARLKARYGALPEIHMDAPEAAVFPSTPSLQSSYSWAQVARQAGDSLSLLREAEILIRSWPEDRLKGAARSKELERLWSEGFNLRIRAAESARYLEQWSAPLLERHKNGLSNEQSSGPPVRSPRPYLPGTLSAGATVVLPIRTDVKDGRLLADADAALDQYWNRSPWAREAGVRFVIRWTRLPESTEFAAGRTDLSGHLARFPPDQAALTTGGVATFVRGHVLVLGPGILTVRSLAHELGHLMGFPDCYSRILVNGPVLGLLGLEVRERNSRENPDELMCDDRLGIPRAVRW